MITLRSHVCRKGPPLSFSFISRVLPAPRHISTVGSTMPRPYQFHICANWLSAPPGRGIKKKSAPFPPDSAVGAWRDHVLTLPRPGFSKTPGEDSFYIQEVRALSYSFLSYLNYLVCRCETSRWVSSVIYCGELQSHTTTRQGMSFGVADGVGGWALSGVDPSLFSQALMYHAHRYAKAGWAGEPEVDATKDYKDREAVEGWELHPRDCLKWAYQATLRERAVKAGVLRTPYNLPVSTELTCVM